MNRRKTLLQNQSLNHQRHQNTMSSQEEDKKRRKKPIPVVIRKLAQLTFSDPSLRHNRWPSKNPSRRLL